jgi:hypothetical protein
MPGETRPSHEQPEDTLQSLLSRFGSISDIPPEELETIGLAKQPYRGGVRIVKVAQMVGEAERQIDAVEQKSNQSTGQKPRRGRPRTGRVRKTSRLDRTPQFINDTEDKRERLEQTLAIFKNFSFAYEQAGEQHSLKFTESDLTLINKRLKDLIVNTSPDTLKQNFQARFSEAVSLLGVKPEEWKEAIVREPSLLQILPGKLQANMKDLGRRLSLDYDSIRAINRQSPRLWQEAPATIERNVTESAGLLGVSVHRFIEAGKRRAQLFGSRPATLKRKADLYQTYFQLETDRILRKPSLLAPSPERILSHYVIGRLARHKPAVNILLADPLSEARQVLDSREFEKFKIIYSQLTALSQQKRKRQRKLGATEELKVYDEMCAFIDKYFGRPGQPMNYDALNRLATTLEARFRNRTESKK